MIHKKQIPPLCEFRALYDLTKRSYPSMRNILNEYGERRVLWPPLCLVIPGKSAPPHPAPSLSQDASDTSRLFFLPCSSNCMILSGGQKHLLQLDGLPWKKHRLLCHQNGSQVCSESKLSFVELLQSTMSIFVIKWIRGLIQAPGLVDPQLYSSIKC